MRTLLIIVMEHTTSQDEKERKAFLDSCSVSELSPEEAEIVLMQMFPKKVTLDVNLDDL